MTLTQHRQAQIKDLALDLFYDIRLVKDKEKLSTSEASFLAKEIIKLNSDRKDMYTYMDIKSLKKGKSIVYFIGTTEEAHSHGNTQQMGVVREAIKDGIATATQRIIKKVVKKADVGLDMVNVYAYTVTRT